MTADTAADAIAGEIRRHGSIPFSRFQELALYGTGGFYERGGAGRHRDFLTSAEVGPLFGAVVARRIEAVWTEFGRPDPFVVIEPGAGPGSLAIAVLAAVDAELASAMRYVLIDRAAAQRGHHADHLEIVPATEAFAKQGVDETGEPCAPAAAGPLVVSLETLPRDMEVGVMIANELLDNLPVELVERNGDRWMEVRVVIDNDGAFQEQLMVARPALSHAAEKIELRLSTTLAGRIPIQRVASEWLTAALGALDAGRVIAFDYARATRAMAELPMSAWLRTYRDHTRGHDPLTDPGSADITCDVALDQLNAVRHAEVETDQASWLREHGLDELVATGRERWRQRAAVGDLEALRARSRIGEADALTDQAGLGAHRVLEWKI